MSYLNDVDLEHLRRAIGIAHRAREHNNHPFGAVLTDGAGNVVLEAENTVNTKRDKTGHAELNLVRRATQKFSEQELATSTMYASTELCAMCAGATFWAGIGRVVYALSELDLYAIAGHSPDQLVIPCRDVFARAGRKTEVHGPCTELDDEARAVHANFWRRNT